MHSSRCGRGELGQVRAGQACCRRHWRTGSQGKSFEQVQLNSAEPVQTAAASNSCQANSRSSPHLRSQLWPIRFVPADVAHIRDDVASLTRLFFAERDGLQMQDISKSLAGLTALLKLLERPTGPLLEEHRAARRASLLAGVGGGTAAAAAGPSFLSVTESWQHWSQREAAGAAGSIAADGRQRCSSSNSWANRQQRVQRAGHGWQRSRRWQAQRGRQPEAWQGSESSGATDGVCHMAMHRCCGRGRVQH
eukprot:GHRQ01002208.1.p1 GENE.GHRQ01002208.1~~GHRQ01002208.1.p1  ORF type:complete len:287 (+),score=74.18 GHRQ01002208.1:112-861(+)